MYTMMGFALFVQENVTGWEPSGADWPFTWQLGLTGVLVTGASAAIWKLLIWFLESRRGEKHWARARIWWPSVMLLWGGLLLAAMEARNGSLGWMLEVVLLLFAAFNLPALIVTGILIRQLNGPLSPIQWINVLAVGLTMWVVNYFIVRLAERRVRVHAPISLRLSDAASDRSKDSGS